MTTPVQLNRAIEQLAKLDAEVTTKEGELRAAKKKFNMQHEKVLELMQKSQLQKAGTPSGINVRRKSNKHYQIVAYDRFVNYVQRNRAFELFQRRLSKRAIEERLEAGKKIPGINLHSHESITISRRRN